MVHPLPVAMITLSLIMASLISAEKHDSETQHALEKRILPIHQECDPSTGRCRKGDWIASNIADCGYDWSISSLTCSPLKQSIANGQWTVDLDRDRRCVPLSIGVQPLCESADLPYKTRCVCSRDDTSYFNANACKCQYWPDQDIGATEAAFCTGYYLGNKNNAYSWACCNNQGPDQGECAGRTYHGRIDGDPLQYCTANGQLDPTSEASSGQVKYYFNCGNCECQNSCAMECTNKFGDCGQWLDCFKGCCLELAKQPRAGRREGRQAVSDMNFCGNGVCSKDENVKTCPTDCCQTVNPNQCSASLSLCTPKCCQDSTCCSSTVRALPPGIYLWAIIIILSYLTIYMFI